MNANPRGDAVETMYDVVIAGAGPSGLYAALRIAGEGLDVLVVEEHADIGRPTHCTGVVSAELQDLHKIPREIVLNRPSTCRVVTPSGRPFEFHSPGEEITVMDRAAFDQVLADGALKAGAAIRTSWRVEHVATEGDCVEIWGPNGARVRARALVLACGVTYRFHALMGSRVPSETLHTAQLEVDASPAQALEIHLGRQVAPEGFAWLVPIQRGDRARVKAGVLLRGDARAHLRAFLDGPRVAGRLKASPEEPVRRLLPVGVTRRAYGNRMLAIGDAAGLTKPVTGGGIFYSLLSAAFAAETLVEGLRDDDLSARRLLRYETRWRQSLMPEIRTGLWFRRVLSNLSDRDMDSFVAAAASDDIQALMKRAARFNWHRPLILALLRKPGIKSIIFRSLFR